MDTLPPPVLVDQRQEVEEKPVEHQVDDETLPQQLNLLDEIEVAADKANPDEVAQLVQTQMVAFSAWSAVSRGGRKGK